MEDAQGDTESMDVDGEKKSPEGPQGDAETPVENQVNGETTQTPEDPAEVTVLLMHHTCCPEILNYGSINLYIRSIIINLHASLKI